MTETQVTQADIRNALDLAWRALLRDVDNVADSQAMSRAADHADTTQGWHGYDARPAEWYAAAINHYLDR